MENFSINNLPDEVYRGLQVRAAHNDRNIEDEIRFILEEALCPAQRIKLGSLLTSIAQDAGPLSDEEHALFEKIRDKTPVNPITFE